MASSNIHELLGQTDIYLVDQILKNRYGPSDRVLDAGCGRGRNLQWFLHNKMEVFGIDKDPEAIYDLKSLHTGLREEQFQHGSVESMPFANDFFDHVISSAVLHFASGEAQFLHMFGEMVRVLKPGGSLFIRMTSDRGLEENLQPLGDGVYLVPDGSTRFLLTRELLHRLPDLFNISLVEPFKSVLVEDIRSMCTLVCEKNFHPL